MHMPRPGDGFHVHHIHGKTLQIVRGLEDAAVADAAAFAVAQPAVVHARLAGGLQLPETVRQRAMLGIEPIGKAAVERLAGDLLSQGSNLAAQLFSGHEHSK